MKKILLFLLICISLFFMDFFIINSFNAKSEKYEKIVKDNDFQICELETNDGIIGVIKINKLNIEAPIMEGTDSEVLKVAVGHFEKSDFWNGNVALASHNRGSYAHYFQNINQLENGDEIEYETVYGKRNYKVAEKNKIKETEVDKVYEKLNKNSLTMVTCITGEKEYRLCIKAVEI